MALCIYETSKQSPGSSWHIRLRCLGTKNCSLSQDLLTLDTWWKPFGALRLNVSPRETPQKFCGPEQEHVPPPYILLNVITASCIIETPAEHFMNVGTGTT